MAIVGLGDVYRYGAKIVGYLLVVSIVAGAFLGGGAYLASRVMTLTDPTLSALSQTQAFVGVFLMAIGALLGLIGFFGLAHKLLTEAMVRALAAHDADGVLEVADVDAESGATSEDDAEPSGSVEPESAPETAARAVEGQSPSDEPADDVPGHEPTVDSAEPVDEPPVGGEPAPTADVRDEPIEPTEYGDPAEYGDSAEYVEPAEPAADVDDSPPEWTPPDPSEFEKPTEESIDDGSTDAVVDSEPVIDPEPVDDSEPADIDEIPDDVTLADEGVEGFETGGEDDPLADRLPSDDE